MNGLTQHVVAPLALGSLSAVLQGLLQGGCGLCGRAGTLAGTPPHALHVAYANGRAQDIIEDFIEAALDHCTAQHPPECNFSVSCNPTAASKAGASLPP